MSQMAVTGRAMESFVIEGARPLKGRIEAAGNKNGALPILAAGLRPERPARLSSGPRIRGGETRGGRIADLGADSDGTGTRGVRAHAADLRPHELARERAS